MSREKYKPTPEKQAELEKSRTLSDAELLQPLRIRELYSDEKLSPVPEGTEIRTSYGSREKIRTLMEKGEGKYVVQEGEKRLEVTEGQIEKARHEMFKDLERQAIKKEALARIGLESVEGLPHYNLADEASHDKWNSGDFRLKSADNKWSMDHPESAICCAFDRAMSGGGREVGKYRDPKLMQKILRVFYSTHPEVENNPEKPFVLTGDFGKVVVKGDKMEYFGLV